MLDLLKGNRHPLRPHPIRLNRLFRSDLTWWRLFAARWNGVSCLPPSSNLPRLQMASDASGSWGCGAWYATHWFQLQWNTQSAALPIMAKELLPVVLACAVWGKSWSGCRVTVLCDNQAVVACLHSRTCLDHHIMHMLRTLAFIEASSSFALCPQYISTTDNHLADDLSCDCLSSFLSKVPDADRRETSLPGPLVVLLLDPTLDWTSPRYFQDGLAPSTRRTYDSAMRKFSTFCEHYHVTDPFPVSEFLLCAFAAYMADSGLTPQTVKSYLSAIRNTQLSLGLPDPRKQSSLPMLKRVQAGISRARLGRGHPSRVRLPITAALLRRIKHELGRTSHPERIVLWAICCVAFFGFCRLGNCCYRHRGVSTRGCTWPGVTWQSTIPWPPGWSNSTSSNRRPTSLAVGWIL